MYGGLRGCQNRSCMMRKNDEYLVQQALQLLKADPRTVLATVGDTPDSVIEHLEEDGYRIQELDYYLDYYDTAPEMPEAPQAECYSSEENYAEAVKRYEAALARFTEQTRQLEFDVTEGRVRKYAIIGMFDVEIRYEDIPEEEQVSRSRGCRRGTDGLRHDGSRLSDGESAATGSPKPAALLRAYHCRHEDAVPRIEGLGQPADRRGAPDVLLRRDPTHGGRPASAVRHRASKSVARYRGGALRGRRTTDTRTAGGNDPHLPARLLPHDGPGLQLYGRGGGHAPDVPVCRFEFRSPKPDRTGKNTWQPTRGAGRNCRSRSTT